MRTIVIFETETGEKVNRDTFFQSISEAEFYNIPIEKVKEYFGEQLELFKMD